MESTRAWVVVGAFSTVHVPFTSPATRRPESHPTTGGAAPPESGRRCTERNRPAGVTHGSHRKVDDRRPSVLLADDRRGLSRAGCESRRRPDHGGGHEASGQIRFQQAGRGSPGADVEGVPPPVPGLDATGSGWHRRRQHRRNPGRHDGPRRIRTHRAERDDGAPPRGQGGRKRCRASADVDHDSQREARRPDRRAPVRGAGSG